MVKLIYTILCLMCACTTTAQRVYKVTAEIDTARHVVTLSSIEGGADVAVSIIDKRMTQADTLTNIASQLLLQNDLAGHIENPSWYLNAPAKEAIPAADALMLTQGWTRYDMPEAIKGYLPEILPYPLERGGQLDGVIRSRWRGKPLANAVANVTALSIGYCDLAVTDSLGRFSVVGVEWPDSTVFVISARNHKGKREGNFDIDTDSFPTIRPINIPILSISDSIATNEPDPNSLSYSTRMSISPQCMQIMLHEVTVKGTKTLKTNEVIDILANKVLSPSDREDIHSYDDLIKLISGLYVINECVLYQKSPVEIWIDGHLIGRFPDYYEVGKKSYITSTDPEPIFTDPESEIATEEMTLKDLESRYPYIDVESIAYIPPIRSAIFSQDASRMGGVLHITTKDPDKIRGPIAPELKIIMPLGYQRTKRFYVPTYQVDGSMATEPHGATLRWYPSVGLTLPLELPLPPDINPSDIGLTVEGLSSDGNIVTTE